MGLISSPDSASFKDFGIVQSGQEIKKELLRGGAYSLGYEKNRKKKVDFD